MQWQYYRPFSKLLNSIWLEKSPEFTPMTGALDIRIPNYPCTFEGSKVPQPCKRSAGPKLLLKI
jgi:hypothetical protein